MNTCDDKYKQKYKKYKQKYLKIKQKYLKTKIMNGGDVAQLPIDVLNKIGKNVKLQDLINLMSSSKEASTGMDLIILELLPNYEFDMNIIPKYIPNLKQEESDEKIRQINNAITQITNVQNDDLPTLKERFPKLERLTFGKWFLLPIGPGILPESLTHLTFSEWFNEPIGPRTLPESLTNLTFSEKFNQSIGPGILPISLTNLTFGYYFQQPIGPGILPKSLTNLILPEKYNTSEFKQKLPKNLNVTYI